MEDVDLATIVMMVGTYVIFKLMVDRTALQEQGVLIVQCREHQYNRRILIHSKQKIELRSLKLQNRRKEKSMP